MKTLFDPEKRPCDCWLDVGECFCEFTNTCDMSKKIEEVEVKIILPDSTLPAKTKDTYNEMAENMSVNEKILLNPIIGAVNDIQAIKKYKFDPENKKTTIALFKEGKKTLGSFNTALKKTKSQLKEPHQAILNQIESFFKILENEYKSSRELLFENFDEHIKEQEEIKKRKEDSKKQEELDRIKELEAKNADALAKLDNQTKISNFNAVKSAINEFQSKFIQEISRLNLESLKEKEVELSSITINDFVTEKYELDENDLTELTNLLRVNKFSCSKILKSSIENYKEDLPIQVEAEPITIKSEDSDAEKLEVVLNLFKSLKKETDRLHQLMSDGSFEDEKFEKLRLRLISETSFGKVSPFLGKVIEHINGFLHAEKSLNK